MGFDEEHGRLVATGARTNTTREPSRRLSTQRSETGTRRTCSLANRGTGEHDTGLRRTGRLASVAGKTGGVGHASRPSELAPIGAGCCLADCHSHADSTPCRLCPSPYGRLLAPNSASFAKKRGYLQARHIRHASVSRLLHRRTARDVRHSEWARSPSYEEPTPTCVRLILAPEPATGSRSRARASLAVLRLRGCVLSRSLRRGLLRPCRRRCTSSPPRACRRGA
jgi:hypothetical protein